MTFGFYLAMFYFVFGFATASADFFFLNENDAACLLIDWLCWPICWVIGIGAVFVNVALWAVGKVFGV